MQAGIIRVDVHGMNSYQAKIKIDSVLRKAGREVYRLLIIHGYNNGTVLKDMILSEYTKHPKVLRIVFNSNLGQTELISQLKQNRLLCLFTKVKRRKTHLSISDNLCFACHTQHSCMFKHIYCTFYPYTIIQSLFNQNQ